MASKELTYKGVKVSYEFRKKKGKTTVVLLHGFLETRKVWADYVNVLSKKYSVLNIDLLGHGDTDCTAYIHTMEEMADMVRVVLKTHDVRKGFLVGHSMGGYVALAFAEKYPDNVKGICMFNSSGFADSVQKKKDRDRAINVVKKSHERFVREVIPNLFTRMDTPGLRAALKQTLTGALGTSKQGIIAALEGMKIRENREIVLKFAPYPVLFVIGKQDSLLNYKDLTEQSKLNEKGAYYLSETGGHLCFFEDKYPCLTALTKFIAKS
ncbi:MAG: pimeloyl-ACP methyl ester carboxylesterase [Saprospiraceae bacterium]|jgi:pimeloyl-ACP methyl ester carboxylesterase